MGGSSTSLERRRALRTSHNSDNTSGASCSAGCVGSFCAQVGVGSSINRAAPSVPRQVSQT
eukprot:7884678-Alexandrium_andersonii.AAC.1